MGKGFLRFKYDIKMIYREPIMVLFTILPLFLMLLFKFGLPPFGSFLVEKTGFHITGYNVYFFSTIIVMTPFMTGILAGFLMLDEKDGNVFDLVLVTPPGFSGYLFSRLIIPIILSIIYTVFSFLLFAGMGYGMEMLTGVVIMVILECAVTTFILFSTAKNKVQGLVLAKGLVFLFIPIFFDLFNNAFLEIIGYASPFFWLYKYISTGTVFSLVTGITINLIWFAATLILGFRRTYKIKIFSH